MVMQVLKTY